MSARFKLSVTKFDKLDVWFRCWSCRLSLVRRATFSERTDYFTEDEFSARAPRCALCKKKTKFYWAAAWYEEEPKK